jgi:hypothetical protein
VIFRVEWDPAALNELTAAWTRANSRLRRRIAVAAHQIDQRLEVDPQNEGESRVGGDRVLFSLPLGCRFRVYPQRSVVRVLRIWAIGRRP